MPTRIAIAVVECEGRFLVGQRGGDVPLAGLAEFPGGKVQPDETVASAAVRECLEETRLLVQPQKTLDVLVHEYDHATVELHFIECRLCGEASQPVAPFRWIERNDLQTLDFPAANAPLIERLSSGNFV